MPIGAILFSWDSKLGPMIDSKYPKDFHTSEELINKIYMTIAYSQEFEKEELIETTLENLTIISYCDKKRVPKFGYEIITIFLEEKERIDIYGLKSQLLSISKDVFLTEQSMRNDIFIKKISSFFEKKTSSKVLLLGRAGTGKSTIKNIVFEGADPKDLLINPLEPTRGISPTVHSWLDLTFGIFDSSGQELSYLLNHQDDQEHLIAFENNDFIFFTLTFSAGETCLKNVILAFPWKL